MNTGRSPLFVLSQECQEIVQRLTQQVDAAGMKVIRSFDLKTTCLADEELSCPYHQFSPCRCEMVILLLYPDNGAPLTLILEGRDAKTEVFLETKVENTAQPVDRKLSEVVFRALFPPPLGRGT